MREPAVETNTASTVTYTREYCIERLRAVQRELQLRGEERFPKRSDLSEEEVRSVKSFFGPWPRALEAAGLKEPRSDDRLQKNREKRIRAKRRRREAKLCEKEKTRLD